MLAVSLTVGLAVGVLLDKLMHLVLSRLVGQGRLAHICRIARFYALPPR